MTTTPILLSGEFLGYTYGAVFYRSTNAFLVPTNNVFLKTSQPSGAFNAVTTTGFSTNLGSLSTGYIAGLACYNHLVYGINSSPGYKHTSSAELVQINPANGATLSSREITLPGYSISSAQGLTVNPSTGVFYALLSVSAGSVHAAPPTTQTLVTIDVSTGVASIVGSISDGSGGYFTSIAFNPADSSC